MAEQWISALQAYQLIDSRYAICKRAYAGLLRSRAKLFLIDRQRHENVGIPIDFWWTKGEAGLSQDWVVGDFSVWLRHKHLEAFGVTFAASDILEMLPLEKRDLTAQMLSIVGSSDWLTAEDAVKYVAERTMRSQSEAASAIAEQARLGFIAARAIEMIPIESEVEQSKKRDGEREWDVPREFWIDCTPTQNWDFGTFTGKLSAKDAQATITLAGVHFRRDAIERALPAPASSLELDASAKPESAAKPTGGRPPAAFNDDLMCAIWGRIYRGELIPQTKADIKNAILDWASGNGHELSETTAKEKARKIFDAFKREGENS